MSKRQRRRVAKRRDMHTEHVKRRSVLNSKLPIALAAVAAPAVAAPAAQASPRAHHLDATALGGAGALVHHSSLAGIGTLHERSALGTHAVHRPMTGSFAGLSRSGATAAASGYTPPAVTAPAPAAPAPAATPSPAAAAPAPAAPTPTPQDIGVTLAPPAPPPSDAAGSTLNAPAPPP
ncbi:MAG: hypothetical protein ACTHMY_26445, partial [Solirubrobacteraceae bacterium]